VAQNSKGLTRGKDRTFKTKKQPLGVTLAATPNPIRTGGATTLAGALTGTGNGGRQVVLQANPWPYAGFVTTGNPQVTDATTGAFAFGVIGVTVNTQYRVLMAARPDVVSPVVVVATTVQVTRHVRVTRGVTGGRIRFSGRVKPGLDGQQVLIQKLRKGNWVTRAHTTARHGGATFSRYSKRVRVNRDGVYRVKVAGDADHVNGFSRSLTINVG
jgi:hypothetical protein